MSSSRLAARSAREALKKETCRICQSRQFTQAIHRSGTVKFSPLSSRHSTNVQRRNYAAPMRLDGPRARADVDARGRLGFYTMNKQQGALKMEPHTAQSIYHDFMAQKDRLDHGSNVLRLAKSAFDGCISEKQRLSNINRVPCSAR
jgi:hypothetical protein